MTDVLHYIFADNVSRVYSALLGRAWWFAGFPRKTLDVSDLGMVHYMATLFDSYAYF